MTFGPVEQMQLLCSRTPPRSIPEEELADEARVRTSAAREARPRSDRAEHVTLGWAVVAAQAPPVPGLRAHGRPDRRRLHGADRRPVRAGRDAADADEGRGRRARGARPRAVRADPARRSVSRSAATRSGWSRSASRGLLELATHYTVARMLERDDFAERYADGHADLRCASSSTRCSRATTRSPSRRTSSSAAPTSTSTSSSDATSSARTARSRRSS